MSIVDCRLSFTVEVQRILRHQQWLIDLERLLDPEQQPPPIRPLITQAVDLYLQRLHEHCVDAADQVVAVHIDKTFRSFWWGLFTCYDVDGLPRTNNDLERFMRFLKSGQRRISGRHNVHDVMIRYGSFLAFLDPQESEAQLLERLQHVSHEAFLHERRTLTTSLLREQKHHRFTYHRQDYLAELEQRWAHVVDTRGS